MALDGKLLARSDGFPAEVARFRECTHLMGRFRKTSGIWLEPPREEFAVRPVDHRLELAHVYVVSFDKRRDLSLTPAGVLQSCNEPIIGRLRFQPCGGRAARTRLVRRDVVIKILRQKPIVLAVPDRKRFWLCHV